MTEFPKKAIILCGGKGTRLEPLTLEVPKSLITVHKKTLIEHLLDLFKKYNVTEIILAVGHMKDQIIEYFGNGKKFGVHISYIEENIPLGTAGPLKLAKNNLNETFFVTNGDELKDIDLNVMYELHKKNNAKITIALTQVKDPTQYGVAKMNADKIIKFIEKPKLEDAPSKLINSGFYIIEPEIINLIDDGFVMLEKSIFPKLAEQEKLFGYQFTGQWFDTGNFERWEKAIKEWKGLN